MGSFTHFIDRYDAGIQLAEALKTFKDKDYIVVALPRGGVVVGYEVARTLGIPLDIVCPRKIGAPENAEFAIGAVTETGDTLIDEDLISKLGISSTYLNRAIAAEKNEAIKRLRVYRQGKAQRDFREKKILLVDDGLATGSTMKAAIATCRSEGAIEIIVAVPVAPEETCAELRLLADELVCLYTPLHFQAIGQFYEFFGPTSDEEVIALMHEEI